MEPRELGAQLELLHSHGFAWALRCCRGDRIEAEDVLHIAYVKILEGKARFEGRSTFRTWLFGVIRRTALEQYRWTWAHALKMGGWWRERTDPTPDGSEGVEAADRTERLKTALARLSRRQAEVLHLVFYQDLTVAEAAEVLGMPAGTARTHYERGKARLRALLGDKEAVG